MGELSDEEHAADEGAEGGGRVPQDGAQAEAEQTGQAQAYAGQHHRAQHGGLIERGCRQAVGQCGRADEERQERGGLADHEGGETEHGRLGGEQPRSVRDGGQGGRDHAAGVFAGHGEHAEDSEQQQAGSDASQDVVGQVGGRVPAVGADSDGDPGRAGDGGQ